MLTLPPLTSNKWIDVACLYNNFFLSRYVSHDIDAICGSIYDTPAMKTLILFMFAFSATRDIQVATVVTVIIVIINTMLTLNSSCRPSEDDMIEDDLGSGFWASAVPTRGR